MNDDDEEKLRSTGSARRGQCAHRPLLAPRVLVLHIARAGPVREGLLRRVDADPSLRVLSLRGRFRAAELLQLVALALGHVTAAVLRRGGAGHDIALLSEGLLPAVDAKRQRRVYGRLHRRVSPVFTRLQRALSLWESFPTVFPFRFKVFEILIIFFKRS